jgi:hypothetical protein
MNVANHTLLPDGSILLVDPLDREGYTLTLLGARQTFQNDQEECGEVICGPLPLGDVLAFLA